MGVLARKLLDGLGGITVVGTTSGTLNASGNITLPSSLLENDVVVIAAAIDGSTVDIVATNYNLVARLTNDLPEAYVAWKRMGVSPDTTAAITFNPGASQDLAWIARAYRGVNTTTAVDNTPTTSTGTNGTLNTPSYTTVTANAKRIIVGALDDDNITSASAAGFENVTFKTAGNSSGSTASIMIADVDAPTPGALDPAGFVTSHDDDWWTTHFALRPV